MVIEIQRNAIGSSVPGFNLGQLKELRVVLPPVEVQQSIVEVLKALDDKIESNRRIECLLQEILEAGFDRESSAVDWDMPLSDWAVLTRGTEPGRDKCNEDSIGQPFIRVGDLGQDRAALYTDLQNLVVANEDDVLVSFDGTPGRVATGMVGVFSSGIRRVDPVGTAVTKGLLYALFKSSRVQSVISEYATGTTILHAGSAIPHIKVPAFEGGVLMKLASEAEELTAKLRSAKRQRSLLSGLRDALLPELLSGRLRVRDAEKVVEEVV
jgi:type I restriction enzyme S subunit